MERGAGPPPIEETSVDALMESILRRVMRVACLVGTLGILSALLSPQPYNPWVLALGVVITLVVFALTFASVKTPILSVVYPWALVFIAVCEVLLMGFRTDAFLLASGGLFVGSMVLSARSLVVLGLGTLAGGSLAMWRSAPFDAASLEQWTGAASSMAAVVVPAAIAGRMLVSSLARTLHQRELLVRSVSEERRALQGALEALENTRTQLSHAQKVELIGQLAGGVAHDMNNALTTVMGEASLLDDRHAERREAIVEAAAYAAKLTHQLMVFGRRETQQAQTIDLCATLRRFVQSMRRVLPSDIHLTASFPEEPIAVVADPSHLLQIVLNLASNAKDAMVGGGTVSLRVSREADRGEGARAVIELADTGAGISQEVLPRIFDPFFTTKPAGLGTGLGLASVSRLVEGMQGSVEVESEPGHGTKFVIRIPISEEAVTPIESSSLVAPGGSETVLVVDDDVRVRSVVFTSLQRKGYRVLEAASRNAALELARTHRGALDLLLTDVVMADGGGAETIRAVQAILPDVKVLVMSGYNDDEALSRGISLGEYPFIPKPFTAEALASAVAAALGAGAHTAPRRVHPLQ